MLRPEAIESVFILCRVTGREDMLDAAWAMFTAIDKMTSTDLANSAVDDVTAPGKPVTSDSMESFWMAETLNFFYLIYCEESLVSLNEWGCATQRRTLAGDWQSELAKAPKKGGKAGVHHESGVTIRQPRVPMHLLNQEIYLSRHIL